MRNFPVLPASLARSSLSAWFAIAASVSALACSPAPTSEPGTGGKTNSGGSGNGGTQASNGGSGNGGQQSSNGGSGNGGASNGGATNGGSSSGGSTNGGSTSGGSASGGSTSGGSTSGGATSGGSTNGGSTNGGAISGGSTNGGSTSGGSTNGGATSGGSTNGGSTNGGATSGGAAAGGRGGATSGGAASGGAASGGAASGGAASGGATSNPVFILGADISQTQEWALTYKDTDGQTKTLFNLLKHHGFNYIRLKTFVTPGAAYGYSSNANSCAGLSETYGDRNHVVALGKQAKAAGMGFLLDFHYSDTWADPGNQNHPFTVAQRSQRHGHGGLAEGVHERRHHLRHRPRRTPRHGASW
ncbi:MAG: glycosyl hydrolase 53 family protein [Polyangiaceae bacterium]